MLLNFNNVYLTTIKKLFKNSSKILLPKEGAELGANSLLKREISKGLERC